MSLEELRRVADSVGERRGWDFSRIRYDRDPVPWEWEEVARRYLRPTSRVLDVGTGGGERFLSLAGSLGTGVGIDTDHAMVRVARENTPPSLADTISFERMQTESIDFPDASFDVVLNRHAPVSPPEIVRVLRAGGVFITQQVGSRNAWNICSLFGCGPGGEYGKSSAQDLAKLSGIFQKQECVVVVRAEHNVRYWFGDVESLVFWLKAVPIPEDFDVEKHWRLVDKIITEFSTAKGIETNEHRELLIVRKGGTGSGLALSHPSP